MKRPLIVTAVIELGAGVALLCFPSATVALLLGSPLDTPTALTLGRLAGTALFALGVACWLAQYDAQSCAARGFVSAMVLYNLGYPRRCRHSVAAAGGHRIVVGRCSSRRDDHLVHHASCEKANTDQLTQQIEIEGNRTIKPIRLIAI